MIDTKQAYESVLRHFRSRWCSCRRFQSHASAIAQYRATAPPGIPRPYLGDGPDSIARAIAAESPRVALLSFGSPVNCGDAIAILRQFHLAYPSIGKVLLGDATEREVVINAFRSEPVGIFSLADASVRLLCKCIVRVSEGQIWANTEQLNYIMDLITEVPSLRVLNSKGRHLLTPREEQVVALVAEGPATARLAR